MKKITFLLLLLSSVTFGQQLVPNQPSFYVSGSGTLPSSPSELFDGNYATPSKVPETWSGCCSYSTPLITGSQPRCWAWNFQKGFLATGSELIMDMQRPILSTTISLRSCGITTWSQTPIWTNNGVALNPYQPSSTNSISIQVKIFTGASSLGPWQQVKDTTINISGQNNDLNIPISNIASRYYKVYFPNITPFTQSFYGVQTSGVYSYTWNCSQTRNSLSIGEIEFYENPSLITSSQPIPLIDQNCTTLTSAVTGEYYQWSTGATTQSITVCSPGVYTCSVTNVAFVGNQDHTSSFIVSNIGSQDNWPAPNGEVYTIHQKGNSIYYGGDFNQVGPVTGSSSLIDGTAGTCNIAFPRVYGTVNVALPDGNGGWYLGGNFTRVGNYTIKNLAHINANNTVDVNFKPEPNATVFTLVLNGSFLYAGGSFTTIKGLVNNYIVKLDKVNGDPIFWNAFCNNTVRTMTLYTDKLIIGGDFSSIGGLTRNRLAAVDTNFVQATTWDPNPNAVVYKVFVNGTKLYVGGDFTNIATVAKSRGAGFTLPAFTVDPYDFGANNRIHDFAFFNNVLYAAGNFTVIGGASRNYLAGLNPLNALSNSFNASADGIVQTVAIYNGAVIAGGDFSNIGGAARNRLASLIPTSGLVNAWNPNVMGLKGTTYNVLCLSSFGSNVLAAGNFWGVGPTVRNNVAAIDVTTGSLLPFDPNANNIVRSITSDATYVYLGGDFTTLNSTVLKNRIAQVNASTGFPTGWNPNADASVNAMVINSGTLYAGGAFGNIGGAARARIAGLSTTTGAATAYNPSANGNVNAFLISSDTLFIGGAFTTIGAQTRNRIAAYTMSNSALTAFDPNANNTVNAFAKINSKLFVGGNFTSIGSQNLNSLGSIDLITGAATTFNAGLSSSTGINALGVSDSSLYNCGGYLYNYNGQSFNNATVLRTASQTYGSWTPQPDDIVRSIYVSNNKVFLGGRFKVVQSRYQPYFTTADIYFNGAAPTYSSISSNSVCQGQSLTVSGANLSSVTGVTINGVSSPFVVSSSSVITVTPNTVVSGALVLSYPGGSVNTNQNITVNSPVAPTFNQVSAICSGSTLSPLPTTSTNNVSGTWSPALNNTATTTYTFTPSTGQCASTTTITITVNALPTASITAGGSTTICQGASVTLNANTGTGLTYQWKNNGTNISGATAGSYTATSAGSYTVVVTNTNNCSSTSNATTVMVNSNVSPSFNQVSAICSGSTLSPLPTNSTNNVSGTWSPALNNTATTTYTFTPSTGQCATTITMTITINALPTASITAGGSTTICQGASVILNANTGTGLTYQWKNNGTNISGATAGSYTATTAGSYTVVVANSNNCSATSGATTVTVNSNVSPSFNQVSAICSGSTLSPLPTTSTNNVSGTWSPALNNTATTTYTFTPSTGQCATTTTMTITVNANATPSFNQVSAICSGSTLSPLPTTSTNNISGTWSPALNNTATTTYTFTPSAGQCATTTSMTITVNPNATPSFTQVAPICLGGSFTLPSISNENISGTWSPVINNTATTTYTFMPNTGQCANSQTMTVVVNSPSTPTFTQLPAICSGGTISLPSVSNENVSGTWSPAINNTATTTYIFAPNTGQCANTQTMTVTVNPLPTVTLASFNSVCDTAGLVNLTGGSPAGGTYSGTSVSNNSFNTSVGIGSYPITYSYTNSNGCSSNATQNLLVISCAGSNVIELIENGIMLYPNPTSDAFTIETSEDLTGNIFVIQDVSGRVLSSGRLVGNKTTIQVSSLSTGSYYFRLLENNQTLKFIKQ
jgi:hypothetical protein